MTRIGCAVFLAIFGIAQFSGAQSITGPASATVGTSATLTINAGSVSNTTQSVTLSVSGPSGYTLSPSSGWTIAKGKASTTVTLIPATSHTPGSVTVSGAVGSTTLTALTVDYVPGLPSSTYSSLTPATSTMTAGGSPITLTGTFEDQYQNPVPDGTPVSFTSNGAASTSSLGSSESTAASATTIGGVATTTFTATLAKTYTITAAVEGKSFHATVAVKPASPTSSTLVATTSPVAAGASTTLTLTALDTYLNPVSGLHFSVASTTSGTKDTFSTPGTTNASGVATVTWKSQLATSHSATATLTASQIEVVSNSVEFVPAACSLAASTFGGPNPSPETLTAGADPIELTLLLTDAYGNAITTSSSATFTTAGTSGDYTFGTSTSPTTTGTITTTFTAQQAKTYTITASITSGSVHGTKTTVVAVQPDGLGGSTLVAASTPATVVADGKTTITMTLTAQDSFFNPVSGVTFSVAGSGSGNTFSTPAKTNSKGVSTFTWKSTDAVSQFATATFTNATGSVQSADVTFVPGPLSATGSTITWTGTPLADGVTGTPLTVTLADAHGNPVNDAGAWTLTGGTGTTYAAASGTVTSGNTFTSTMSCGVPETVTVTATVGKVKITQPITFAQDPVGATSYGNGVSSSDTWISPTTLVAGTTSSADIQLWLADENGVGLVGTPVTLVASGTGNKLTPASGVTVAASDGLPDGIFKATLSSTVAQQETITAEIGSLQTTNGPWSITEADSLSINGEAISLGTGSLTAIALAAALNSADIADTQNGGVLMATVTTVIGRSSVVLASSPSCPGAQALTGQTLLCTTQLVIGGAAATLTKLGLTATTHVVQTANLPWTVTFTPGSPSATTSTISITGDPTAAFVADGQTTYTLSGTIKDGLGNPLASTTVYFDGVPNDPVTADNGLSFCAIGCGPSVYAETDGEGRFSSTLTASKGNTCTTAAGVTTCSAGYSGKLSLWANLIDPNAQNVIYKPFTAKPNQTPVSSDAWYYGAGNSQSLVWLDLNGLPAGHSASVSVGLTDHAGNALGNETVKLTLQTTAGGAITKGPNAPHFGTTACTTSSCETTISGTTTKTGAPTVFGTFTTTFTAPVAGSWMIVATGGASSVPIYNYAGQSPTITFVPKPPTTLTSDNGQSVLAITPPDGAPAPVADGLPSLVQLTINDSTGTPVPYQDVTLSLVTGGLSVSQVSLSGSGGAGTDMVCDAGVCAGITDLHGNVQLYVSSTTVGTADFAAQVGLGMSGDAVPPGDFAAQDNWANVSAWGANVQPSGLGLNPWASGISIPLDGASSSSAAWTQAPNSITFTVAVSFGIASDTFAAQLTGDTYTPSSVNADGSSYYTLVVSAVGAGETVTFSGFSATDVVWADSGYSPQYSQQILTTTTGSANEVTAYVASALGVAETENITATFADGTQLTAQLVFTLPDVLPNTQQNTSLSQGNWGNSPSTGYQSLLTTGASSVNADGVATWVLSVPVVDSNGVALPAEGVTISGFGANDNVFAWGLNGAWGYSNGTLTASTNDGDTNPLTVYFSSPTPETDNLTIAFGAPYNVTQSFGVSATFTAPAVMYWGISTTVTAAAVPVDYHHAGSIPVPIVPPDGASTATVTLTVVDTNGVPLGGQAVALAGAATDLLTSGTSTGTGQLSGMTNSAGQFQATVASSVAEADTLTATVAGPGNTPLALLAYVNFGCEAGLSYCASAGQCVSLQSDPNNCGACGNTCGGSASSCSLGACSTCEAAPTGLISWWKGEGNADDALGVNDGTAEGGNALQYATGMVGDAFSFDGTNYVEATADNLPLEDVDRTVELWANVSSIANGHYQGLLDYGTYVQFFSGIFPDGGVGLDVIEGGDHFPGIETSPLSSGTWYHLAAVYQGGTIINYVNGVQQTSQNYVYPFSSDEGPDHLYLGNVSGGGSPVTGLVDEVSIYNRALAASEVASIYAAGSNGKCSVPAPPSTAPASCAAILAQGSTSDGLYWIDPGGDGNVTQVWCDMTTAGGGWTIFYAGTNGQFYIGFDAPDCPNPGTQCVRQVPASLTTSTTFAVSCGGAALTFAPNGQTLTYFQSGQLPYWQSIGATTGIAGNPILSDAESFYADSSGWLIGTSNDSAMFANMDGAQGPWECNGQTDLTSLVRLMYR